MAQLTYREAVAAAIAQEMERDDTVAFIGEDVAKAGGVFKATVGLYDKFGPRRVIDTPISEQAILGAAMGAAMTGMRPIAEIMFSDFLAVCWDFVANEMSKSRYMSDGQLKCPLVVRTGNGGGSRFGAQHSQSIENWAMAIPGIKVVAPSTPADVKGLLAASIRDNDPVIFFEHKSLYAVKGEVPEGEHVDTLGTAKVVRKGKDAFGEDHRFQKESQDLYHKGKSSMFTKLKQALKKFLPKKLISFRQDILQIQKIRNDIKMNWFVNNTGDNCYIRGILQKK